MIGVGSRVSIPREEVEGVVVTAVLNTHPVAGRVLVRHLEDAGNPDAVWPEWTAELGGASMSAWAVGRNMPGYLPDPESVAYFRTWKAAREYLECEMRLWAQEEDESWWPESAEAGPDAPNVEAHVGALFADGPASLCTPGLETGAYVEDARGVMWAWWIAPVDESDVDEYVWDEED